MEDLTGGLIPAGMEVLVIEDSPTQAEQLRYMLEKHGYRVATAGNGRVALAMMADRKPGLIITDVVMPEMDGYELCRAVKGDERLRDVPVILLTSLSDPHDVIRGLECGADNFITKPYDETALLYRIINMQMERQHGSRVDGEEGVEVYFDCRKFMVTADRRQALNFLLSTYEAAIQKNRELSRARDELREINERLAAANRDLEAFGYTVSHDLRSPLTTITGYCQVLTEIYGEKLDEQCAGFVRDIQSAAGRMEQLISTILNFSRLTLREMHRERVDLSGMARAIALDLKMREPDRRVTFAIADGVVVDGDEKLLRVVLENLIGNAWKYSGKREEARIEFGTVETEGKTACFVRDNGAGFDMDLAGRLFAPFERLHGRNEFQGIGIGLATVQRIVQRHDGRVWAEGETGKGASFYFTLG